MREAQWKSKDFAKELRRHQTAAEKKLWSSLRSKQMGGHKFRRQHPIGPFIVDFACLKEKLIIEVDGVTHESEAEKAYDKKRSCLLEEQGWRVVRISNEAVFDHLEDVLEAIGFHLDHG